MPVSVRTRRRAPADRAAPVLFVGRGRIGADEEGARRCARSIQSRELVVFAIERVEQHDAAHALARAALGQRIGGRQIAAAIGDDERPACARKAPRAALGIELRRACSRPRRGIARRRRASRNGRRWNPARRPPFAARSARALRSGLGELARRLLAIDDVARQRRLVAMEKDDDDARRVGIEIRRRRPTARAGRYRSCPPNRPPPRGEVWPSRPSSLTSRNGRGLSAMSASAGMTP